MTQTAVKLLKRTVKKRQKIRQNGSFNNFAPIFAADKLDRAAVPHSRTRPHGNEFVFLT